MSIKGAAIVGLFLLAIGFLLYFGTKARLPISMSTLSLVSFRARSRHLTSERTSGKRLCNQGATLARFQSHQKIARSYAIEAERCFRPVRF
jgi:hypothetical protein